MQSQNPEPRPAAPSYVWVVVLMGVLVLAVQAVLLFVVLDTRSGVESVTEDVRGLELQLAGIDGTPPTAPATAPTTSTSPPPTGTAAPPATDPPGTTVASQLDVLPSSPAPELATDASGLPRLESNTAEDPAVGAQLGDLGALEWAAGQELVVDLADGKARAVVVWAHWCPPCQELLPQLATWQVASGVDLENMELITVASATDPEAENPLQQYLSEQEFPFPVLLDSTDELAARLGVNAFPFWVFVSPEGQVIGRVAGQLPQEQFETLFSDLEDIGAGG